MIRHANDYGAILLLDDRFADADRSLSAWLRPAVLRPPTFAAALSGLSQVSLLPLRPSLDQTTALVLSSVSVFQGERRDSCARHGDSSIQSRGQ